MPNKELENTGQDDFEARSQEIALLAYAYWQDRGCQDGHDVEDWLLAEQEVRKRPVSKTDDRRREARTAA